MECKDTIISKTNFHLPYYYVSLCCTLSGISAGELPGLLRICPFPAPYLLRRKGTLYGADTRLIRNRHGATYHSIPPRSFIFYFSFSKSRISVSNTSSLLGAGGAGAAGASAFFFSVSLVSNFINIKIEKAIMRKSKVTCRKLP